MARRNEKAFTGLAAMQQLEKHIQETRAITVNDLIDVPPACSFSYGRIVGGYIIRSEGQTNPAPNRRPKRKHKNKKRRR